jgi:hypothetical protein
MMLIGTARPLTDIELESGAFKACRVAKRPLRREADSVIGLLTH